MPGRNEPCHCGSGRKYKHCCARKDAEAAPALRLLGRDSRSENERLIAATIATPTAWEADVTPMPAMIASDLAARPAATVLVANDIVLCADLESHPPADAAGVAALIANAVSTILASGGAPPTVLRVRHRDVASHLSPLVAPLGVKKVIKVETLPMVNEFAGGMRQHLLDSPHPMPAVSHPLLWAAWDLSADLVADLFRAAAAFFCASPWAELSDADLLEIELPTGARWFACILGNASESFGLLLYEHIEDYLAIIESGEPDGGLTDARGVVIAVSFDRRSELRKEARREIEASRWTIAGPSAYPSLWVLNTLGGGLRAEVAREVVLVLDAVAALVSDHLRAGDRQEAARTPVWTLLQSGTVVRMPLTESAIWDVPEVMTPSLAEGVRADPRAFVTPDNEEAAREGDREIAQRFGEAMRASHADESRAMTDVGNVTFFIEVIHAARGVRLAALTELDLRLFLYDEVPRKMKSTKATAHQIRMSLQRFVTYLAAHEQLTWPWARAILRDRAAFELRWDLFPGGHWWDADVGEWIGELWADLDARVMEPSQKLSELGEWSATSGITEATLRSRLQREWLIWRDAEIRAGHAHPDELWPQLERRQAHWETTPDPTLDGLTPARAIARERGAQRQDRR